MAPADDDLEARVKKLKGALDKGTEPDFGWKVIAPKASSAATTYLSKHKGGKEVAPDKVEATFAEQSKTYLTEVGLKGADGADASWYSHLMRNMLGQEHYQLAKEAIKKGDTITSLYLLQQAHQKYIVDAKADSVVSDIENRKPDEKVGVAKAVIKDLGGDDYTKGIGYPQLASAYRSLTEKRRIAKHYSI